MSGSVSVTATNPADIIDKIKPRTNTVTNPTFGDTHRCNKRTPCIGVKIHDRRACFQDSRSLATSGTALGKWGFEEKERFDVEKEAHDG